MSATIRSGLVAFFDILGYQNLLERNEPEKVAKDVLPVLQEIKNSVRAEAKTFLKLAKFPTQAKIIEPIMDSMEWVIFSDTVLITLPFDGEDSSPHLYYWLVFLAAARIVQTKLFDAGLPVRGAIDYGKFLVENNCFAGRCIVKAYQLASKIEMAACVLSEQAAHQFQSNGMKSPRLVLGKAFIIEYLVPTKDGEEHMQTVVARSPTIKQPDIHKAVMHAFWGHGKDIPQSVRPKVANTEQWLEFLEKAKPSK
jgi:hypothetical protein